MENMKMNDRFILNKAIKDKFFSAIESLLFVHGDPISLKDISVVLGEEVDFVRLLMDEFELLYENSNRGLKLFKIDDKYQFGTKPENEKYIVKLLKTNQRQSLSQAAIETLSIISYKQPVTRVEIEEIRGVRSDKAIQTLLDKDLIKESGRLEVIGRPILYGTTDNFLKQFGIERLEELPALEDVQIDD
ncbi:segregation and condensation protein B [Candidatus Arthromitus sp. SFB-mouse-NYU]|nr:segregation and condensation protein B [Candidatus Arthromitus sp. SFB-mouse-NYU]